MLKTRIIPTLLWKGYGLVKGVGFDSWRSIGTVLPAIKVYNARQVDELILLDILATKEGREPDYLTIEEYTAECFVPLTYGGGISTIEHIRNVLLAGADKVAINAAAFENPELVQSAARRFGSQCIIVSVDVRQVSPGHYQCFTHNGTRQTGVDPVTFAKRVESLGAGEILLCSIERDGSQLGYDLELIRTVSDSVSIPVIASGGCSGYQDMHDALIKGQASAIAASAIFSFTQSTPLEAKRYLKARGVSVRIVEQ